MKLALLITLVPMLAFGMDRMTALSLFESAHNDRAVGSAGEISRYQILKAEWNKVTTSRAYTNPDLARKVTVKLLEERIQRFYSIYKRYPKDFEFYALWNAPGQVYNKRISRVVAERARRFANLCQVPTPQYVGSKAGARAGQEGA